MAKISFLTNSRQRSLDTPAISTTVTLPIALPDGDYVSPGLLVVRPDAFFPNMGLGDTTTTGWKYHRQEIPHNWYVDLREPGCGFINRDEALILYNTALKFKGKRALEIGCWMGWSACHLMLAGVRLDVIDPLLDRSPNRESVVHSLASAMKELGTNGEILLVPGCSPNAVEALAAQGRRWSLFFVDGNHEHPYPANDAAICDRYAERDAMILFHDLASPDVAEGLAYLGTCGWKTMVYNTAQIMGVAWRGDVEPIRHYPDPRIPVTLPPHLMEFPVSGLSPNATDHPWPQAANGSE